MKVLFAAIVISAMAVSSQSPRLDPAEKAAGWKLLFDGKSLAGWRGFQSQTPPAGWRVENGVLIRDAAGGDLMTVEQFENFELSLEWRISQNGNSGIMFRVSTDGEETWHTGPEFQVLDNAGHADGKDRMTSAGSNYAVHAPSRDMTKPVGEWNATRIIANGNHVEHWLNGVKLFEYEIGSPDWTARVNASKFVNYPRYGRVKRGHIALQDHGDVVAYRNIKIKELRP